MEEKNKVDKIFQDELNEKTKSKKLSKSLVTGIVVLLVILFFVIVIAVFITERCRMKSRNYYPIPIPSSSQNTEDMTFKPIIYLYPEYEQVVSVKLGNPEDISCSYPRYEDGWSVLAKSSGDLVDLDTGRNLYALYWEGKNYKSSDAKDGFIVKGEDSAEFLEEKLEILGLNERETEEFIVYWLPKLEENPYNFIRFASKEEIDEYMPLNVSPEPDTVIRVMMEFKKVTKQYEVKKQILEPQERNGFTVVEWGRK